MLCTLRSLIKEMDRASHIMIVVDSANRSYVPHSSTGLRIAVTDAIHLRALDSAILHENLIGKADLHVNTLNFMMPASWRLPRQCGNITS